jgi:hypothetical protein
MFQNVSDHIEAGGKSFAEYLKLPCERLAQYQAYFKVCCFGFYQGWMIKLSCFAKLDYSNK